MSTAIKRATAAEYNLQVARERDTRDGIDQGANDELFARNLVNHRFRGRDGNAADSLIQIRESLINGISFRMRRFRDWKEHFNRRLRRERNRVRAQATKPDHRPLPEQEPEAAQPQQQKADKIPHDAGRLTEISQKYDAVASSKQSFESRRYESPKSVGQSTSVSLSVRSRVGGSYVDWPRPPAKRGKYSENDDVYCPYCFDRLEWDEATKKTKWRFVLLNNVTGSLRLTSN